MRLRNMSYRAGLIQGKLRVRSREAEGRPSADRNEPVDDCVPGFALDRELDIAILSARHALMSAASGTLPVIESCDGCGACCMVVTRPPFYHVFEDMGEEAWDRLERERPNLVAELRADYQARQESGGPFYGTPCIWFDAETLRCRHYDYRPLACQMFEVGDEDCRDARRRAAVH